MTKIKQDHLREFYDGYGIYLPRKVKKKLYGKKMSRGKLRQLLDLVTIGTPSKTMYVLSDINPYPFCPCCGFIGMRGTGNKTQYPEHWEYFYCLRCGFQVGYIDNSPFVHALECKEYGYKLDF